VADVRSAEPRSVAGPAGGRAGRGGDLSGREHAPGL